ncbi:hypothetical protein KJA16_00560 [Patescibacteria group bacterium]|nr:hypothetical protein [Patescibacteria group bacterium]
MERKVEGEVTEIKPGLGVYVREGHGQWFILEESLKSAGITKIKIGDKISFKAERGLCGAGRLKEIAKITTC